MASVHQRLLHRQAQFGPPTPFSLASVRRLAANAARLAVIACSFPLIPSDCVAQAEAPLSVIGAENGPASESFGFIGDVEASARGDVFILDQMANHIAWFDSAGQFVQYIGRRGSGPGEFRSVMRMAIDERLHLHVYDASGRKISTFSVIESPARHLADQRIDEPISDLCVLGTRRFAVFPRSATVVAELDSAGRIIRSFGPAETPDRGTARRLGDAAVHARDFYNLAQLACDVGTSTIVLLHEHVPVVRAFSATGTMRWRHVLTEYHGREVYVPDGDHPAGIGARIDPEVGSAHAGSAIAFADSRHLVVTLWEGSAQDIEGRLEARILDVANGEQLDNRPPPGRLSAVIGGRAYAFDRYPYPKVTIYPSSTLWLGN